MAIKIIRLVEVNAAAPENGNVKFTVAPKAGNGE